MNRRLFDLCCMLPIPCTFQNLYIRLLICTETTTQFYLLSSVTVCPQGCLQMHSVPQRVGSQTVPPPPRGCVSSHHLTHPHTVNALSCLEVRTFHSWVLSAFKLVPFYSSIACSRVVPVLVGGGFFFFFCLMSKSVIRSENVPCGVKSFAWFSHTLPSFQTEQICHSCFFVKPAKRHSFNKNK